MGLFGSKKETIEDTKPTVAVPQPVPFAVTTEEALVFKESESEYEIVAREIGFSNPALVWAQLKRFLLKNGIIRFPHEDVNRFLDSKVDEINESRSSSEKKYRWCWAPLRQADSGRLTNHISSLVNGFMHTSTYRRAVPISALKKVQLILKEFPYADQLVFYVSDYTQTNPDPFLMVSGVGIPETVIDHWDEPGFRATT